MFLLKPIYAFADSRLLFWRKEDGSLFLDDIKLNFKDEDSAKDLTVAYIGASNHDDLEFFHEIFEPAIQQIGISNYRMILTHPMPDDGMFLERADIILLAGGSVEIGWNAFEKNGFKELILRRYYDGALLIGISAGAVQLGRGGLTDDGSGHLSTFGLVPFYVDVHDEQGDWASLHNALELAQTPSRGIGIPAGGGIVYNHDTGDVKPVCKSVIEIFTEDSQSREAVIFPESEEEVKN